MPSEHSSDCTPPRKDPGPEYADELLPSMASELNASPPPFSTQPLVLAIALVLVALNLRPALSSLAPVLPEVMRDTGISATVASILTMSPVLCLGLFGFLAPRLASRFGPERTVVGGLLLLTAGTALRGVPLFPVLLLGTLTAGAAIGIVGVLLPSLVKRDFPTRASLMTGVYTTALSAGAAVAAGFTVPLANWLSAWPQALAFWALPAFAAAIMWLPKTRTRQRENNHSRRYQVHGLWRDPLAWQVTLFMGLQSSLAYIIFGWLAPILRDRGLEPVTAGFMVSVTLMVQLSTTLTAPIIAGRRASQSGIAAGVVLLTMIGLSGILYAPLSTLWLWIVVLGLGQGASFAISLALIVLRAKDTHVAAHLSGMAQSVGYVLASLGPLLVGLLHDYYGSWSPTGVLFIAICVLAMGFGFGAGRPMHVRATVSLQGA